MIVGLLKKAASGVLALFPDLRAPRLGPLRAVSAHVLPVRSARKNSYGLAGRTFLNRPEVFKFSDAHGQICS